ncbi:MAG: hypothetical protein O2812_03825 [Chloroflexi bacterium]|nr:hypothetical protein [Chloroflexota bacterium]
MNSTSSRWLIGAGAVIAVLVVASVLVAVLGGSGETTAFPENTPEGVVQRYLQAVQDRESQTAFDYLGAELQEACTLQELRDQTRWSAENDNRVILEGTEVVGGQTIVTVRVTQLRVDPPSIPNESSFSPEYILEQQDGNWRFIQPPWPMGWCQGLTLDIEKLPLPRN